MRIFLVPGDGDDGSDSRAFPEITQRAFEVLRDAGLTSARIGGFINDQGVVLVDGAERESAVAVLERAGIKTVADAT